MRHTTDSAKATKDIASKAATLLLREKPRKYALVVGLIGDLGSGKTTFVGGFARALGIRRRMVSPTFTVMRRYRIPRTSPAYRRGYRSLVHVDCYRVHTPAELAIIRFDEWLRDPSAVVLIEWADLVSTLLPHGTHRIKFKHLQGDRREVVI